MFRGGRFGGSGRDEVFWREGGLIFGRKTRTYVGEVKRLPGA